MSKITGRFATKDNRHTVEVCIYNKNCNKPNINIDASNSVKFAGESPIVITQQQSDTFEHILKTQCKIRLVTKQWLGDYLFASNYFSIVVNVWVDDDCVFCGVVKPLSYNQNFAHTWEEIEIVATDLLSTLKDRRLTDIASWDELNAQSQIRPFSWFLGNMDLDTKTVVIPNFPDIDYGEAEMMWTEIDWERIVNPDGSITYYGIEAEIVVLDEETAMNTGELRQGEEKEVTWIESDTDTCIVDGVSYYKEYAHITVCGEDVNTGDWRIGSMVEGGMPEVVSTVSRLDGWTRGALPQPFEYYEHFTTYNVYDNEMEMVASDYIGDQIPEYPQETSYNSYWDLRQGSNTDIDIDETTHVAYYKNYGWVTVNSEAENSGDWVRGSELQDITGKITQTSSSVPSLSMTLNGNVTTYSATFTNIDKEFYFDNLPKEATLFSFDNTSDIHHNFEELSFNDFDTSYVENMSSVFDGCSYLTMLNVSKLDTSSATNMSYMFKYCSYLTTLDVSNFDTSNVTDTREMFEGCRSLTTLNLGNWSNLKSKRMTQMFEGCKSLTSLDLSNFSTSSAQYMGRMFAGCETLTSLDLSNFNTQYVLTMEYMFWGCTSLRTVDVSNFNTLLVQSMANMFLGCESLESLDLSSFNTRNVRNMERMFSGCSSFTSLDLSETNIIRVSNATGMFENCTSLQTLDLSNFDASYLANKDGMFLHCDSLTTLILNNVSNQTFNVITEWDALLPHSCTIYRDGTTYLYNSNTNTWEIQ